MKGLIGSTPRNEKDSFLGGSMFCTLCPPQLAVAQLRECGNIVSQCKFSIA